jgi:hypothetical protein
VLENFCVTVADVVGDGPLGMDFLAATDMWVDLLDGHLHIKQNWEKISWPLRHEDQATRYVAIPIRSVTVKSLSQALVPCTLVGPSGEVADRPTGTIMAEPIGSLMPDTCVPATLVEMDRKVVIPITNFGTQILHIGSDTPLAALENLTLYKKFQERQNKKMTARTWMVQTEICQNICRLSFKEA